MGYDNETRNKMKIKDIKKRMLNYRDFYGQDLVQKDLIKKAKTKKELAKVLVYHRRFLADQANDAGCEIDGFIKDVGLAWST